ncbi:MAG TPA: RNA 2',3'-cyclic phosphodiesterase [Alphaproteobacteria bacterium]|nr:RNA 2',3'-cyclic phosphodiesterase [Alphaproteobacteria bacterium]
MLRLFVAVPIPQAQRQHLGLLAGGVPQARWVPPENHHVTLRFLGDTPEDRAAEIDEALAALRAPAFRLGLAGVGHFGGDRAVRILWAGVEGDVQALHFLRDKVNAALMKAGLPPEGQKFSPHVTLARLRDAPLARVRQFLEGNAGFRTAPFAVDRFVLYRSHLGAGGASYEALAEYPLQAG